MTLIVNLQQTMTSLEIAELTGKQHKDVMRAIRKMEPAWVKVNGRNFALVEYKDAKGICLVEHNSVNLVIVYIVRIFSIKKSHVNIDTNFIAMIARFEVSMYHQIYMLIPMRI